MENYYEVYQTHKMPDGSACLSCIYGIGGVIVVASCLYVFVFAGAISAEKIMEMLKKGHQEAP